MDEDEKIKIIKKVRERERKRKRNRKKPKQKQTRQNNIDKIYLIKQRNLLKIKTKIDVIIYMKKNIYCFLDQRCENSSYSHSPIRREG